MLFGKYFGAPSFTVPKMPSHAMLPPGGSIPTGPTMPGPTFHSFPTSMPATNTGVFTTNQGNSTGPLPYCDQVGCTGNLSCFSTTGQCVCPQADGSNIVCQRRSTLPSCASVGCPGNVQCSSINGPCICPQANGSIVQCSPSTMGTIDDGSVHNDGTTDQNTDSSSGAPNGGSGAGTSTGSSPVCEDGFSYNVTMNMCQPNPSGPAPQDSNLTTVTTTTTDPTTGQVSTTQVVTPVPILPTTVPLPGIPDAPLFYQTPAFKVGMIALGVSVLGVAAILVHRARTA